MKRGLEHPGLRTRRSVHTVLFVLLILAIWQGAAFTGCTYLQIGFLRLICPVGFIEALLATRTLLWDLVPGFLVVVGLIVLLGRFYCSWVCPATFVARQGIRLCTSLLPQRVSGSLRAGFAAVRQRIHERWKPGAGDAVALCAGLGIGILLAGYPAWSVICPVGTLSRSIIDGVVHHDWRMDSVFLLLPVLAGLFHAHGWKCLCPLGSVHGFFSAANRTARVKVPSCVHCRACARVCPMGLQPDKNGEFVGKDCIKCLECLNVCPKKRTASGGKTAKTPDALAEQKSDE